MAKVSGSWLTGAVSGTPCKHEGIYVKTNKSSGQSYAVKYCNPYEGDPSTAQVAAQEAFASRTAVVRAWLAANRPSTSNPNGTVAYQQALKLKKTLKLGSVTEVAHKYYSNGAVSIPGVSSDSSTTYTVTLTASPSGAGTLTGGGSVAAGGSTTIKAVPNTGYTFVKWSDNNTSAERVITVNSDLALTAIFSGSGPEE